MRFLEIEENGSSWFQLDVVRRLLDSRGVGYWVDENAISLDGAPEIAVVNLGRGGDAEAVQDLLDNVV